MADIYYSPYHITHDRGKIEMVTQKEIELCQEILSVAIKISMQHKYLVFADYVPHVKWMEVRILSAPFDANSGPIPGWFGAGGMLNDGSYVQLSTDYKLGAGEEMADVVEHKVEQLEIMLAKLTKLLDVDADGVPV